VKWILLVTLMSHNQGSMTSQVFADYKSCMKAGALIKEAINKDTIRFRSSIKFHCISVSGVE